MDHNTETNRLNPNTMFKILYGILIFGTGFLGILGVKTYEVHPLILISVMIGIPEIIGGLWLLSEGTSEYGDFKGWFKKK